MSFKLKFLLTLFLLIVFTPLFLLSTQPAFAFVSHIVRLKYADGSPVVGADVFLRVGEYSDFCECCGCTKDCSRWVQYPGCGWDGCGYDTGVTWGIPWTYPIPRFTTDSHGIVVFSARDGANTGGTSIQRCSTNKNNPLIMAIPYIPYTSGHWRLDNISGYSGADQKADDSNAVELYRRVADDVEWPPDNDEDGHQGYNGYGWSYQGFGSNSSNLARINTGESGGPCDPHGCGGKPFNIYWEWTWVQP